jgi:RimJ/RimL family protein N-acetyltransferase
MNLLLTLPHMNDYVEFHEINQDFQLQSEFPNLRNQSLQEAKVILDKWIIRNHEPGPADFVFVKIAKEVNEKNYYDSSNSKMIGFITVNESALSDFSRTGFKTLLNYGLMEKYRNKGIMTMALKMRIEAYIDLGYNILPAYIKGDNPASERVLRKCGFRRVNDDILGSTFVKRLDIDELTFDSAFIEV